MLSQRVIRPCRILYKSTQRIFTKMVHLLEECGSLQGCGESMWTKR